MANPLLDEMDERLRGELTRLIAELGFAPSEERLADVLGIHLHEVQWRLVRLADAHALLLHPGSTRPWVVHPFALSPGSCWVKTKDRGYWANCLYCGLGVAAALRCDATVTTRFGGEDETVRYEVHDGAVSPSDHLFHLSTPAARWWDNVIFACSTFQPFRTKSNIDDWCARHDLPLGAVLTIPQLWGFAQDWYGRYLCDPWRRKSSREVGAIFQRNGLFGPFWSIP